MQKALYPEGKETCHIAILHPPGGVAAGDRLIIRASLNEQSRALLTTPGATKWYRSEGSCASQQVHFSLGEDAVLEWLPRENILFDGANISMALNVELTLRARYFGWDILSFGRRASGESWGRGRLNMQTNIRGAGSLLWSEVADIDARSGFAASPVGLSGFTVCGTFLVAGYDIARVSRGGPVRRRIADRHHASTRRADRTVSWRLDRTGVSLVHGFMGRAATSIVGQSGVSTASVGVLSGLGACVRWN